MFRVFEQPTLIASLLHLEEKLICSGKWKDKAKHHETWKLTLKWSIICEIKGDIDAKRCNLQAPVSVQISACPSVSKSNACSVQTRHYMRGLELITYCFCIEPAVLIIIKQSDLREGVNVCLCMTQTPFIILMSISWSITGEQSRDY